MISLKELKAKRAEMARGKWGLEENYGDVHAWDGDDDHEVGPVAWSDGSINGMLATHNAADALIDIAEAVLAIEGWTLTDAEHGKRLERLRTALAKVQP